MNHVYRLLWNSSLGAWVAVSELAKSSGKKSSTKISASLCALILSGTIVLPTNSNAYSVASADPCANLSDTRVGIGLNAKACSNDAIAIGQNAQAVNFGSIAIGRESYAESTVINGVGYPSVAVGYKASAIGQDASAFGNNAKANASFTTAIGNFADASSRNALALGNSTSATGVAASAIGNFASAAGLNSVALGGGGIAGAFQGAQAMADGSTAIGGNSTKGAVASGINSTAISGESVASGTNAIAIGDKSKAIANNAIVLGASANTSSTATNAVVMGSNANATGINNISFGAGAQTGNVASIVPDGTPLNGGSQIAIGTNAKTDTAGSIAIGYNSTTGVSQNFGIALGGYAQALGNSAIAIGRRAQSTGVNSTAIGGRQTVASAGGATAIGSQATASGFESLAVGAGRGNDTSTTSTVASGRHSVALGASSKATNTSAIAVGTESNASGESGIAIGTGAQANAKDTISIGTGNIVTGQGSGAIGDPTIINGTGTYSLGNNNGTIDAHETGVFGNNNILNGEIIGVRVVGNTNTVSSDNAIVLGNENTASSLNASVLGNYNTVSGEGGVAIGRDNNVSGSRAVSIGTNSEATAEQTISIGHLTKATGLGATALGWSATASNTQSTALGVGANSSGQNASALGAFSTASGSGSIAAGNSSLASGGLSTAIGSLSRATGTLSVALGAALADKNNSVALGALSDTNTNATQQASATLNGLTYGDFAGQVTDVGMQVSVGAVGRERQIKNVGSGEISALSTDAINGSQLHATNSILGNLGNSIESTLGGNAALNPNGSIAMTNIGNTGQNTVHDAILASKEEVAGGTNVANVTSTIGTNGQTIYTVNADGASVSAGSSAVNVVAGAKDTNNVTDYAVDLSQTSKDSLVKADTALQSVVTQIDGVDVKTVDQNDNKVNFVSGDNVELTANADGSINVGTAADVNFNTVNTTDLTVTGTTQLGNSFTVNNGGSYYTGPITDGNHITNKTYVDQTAAASKTEVEEGKNIKVTSTTGADGQTVYTVATADEVDFDKVTVGDTAISTDGVVIANGPSLTKDGISAGAKKVTDVADGMISMDSKDAINGSQLHAIGNNVTQLFGGNATYVNNQISWNNIGGTGQNTIDDAIKHVNNQVINANNGWNVSTDSGSNATSTVKPGQTVKINGNSDNGVLVTNSGNEIKVSLSDQIKIGSGDNSVSIDGNAGTIKAGNVLIDGSKGNISAGKVNVNGEAGTVNGLTNTTWNPNNIVSGQAATEDQLLQVAQNATAAATAAKTTVTAGENITVSSSKNSDGSTNYQVATNKDVKFDTVTSGSITTDKISVGNVTIDQSGINSGGSKVTNVANGTVSSTSKDAINGSQLHASNTNIYNYLGGGANYETNTGPTYNVGGGSHNNVGDALNSLDQKVTNVTNQLEEAFYTTNQRIDDVENRANAGNAQALATAGLPQAYIPGKSMMAISGGTYRGETGYAIGMSSISDNGKWVFKVSGSGNSRGDFGGTVGAGIQW